MIGTLICGAIAGAIPGLVWAFGLHAPPVTGLYVGAGVGVLAGAAMCVFGGLAGMGGNLKGGETQFVSTAILTLFGMASTAAGLVVWVIRVVFW